MSATIVQKLKVIAANKTRSDSAAAKIIEEAAQIIENGSYKKNTNEYKEIHRYNYKKVIDYTHVCIFFSKAKKIIEKTAKLYGVDIIVLEQMSLGKISLHAESIGKDPLINFCNSLVDLDFSNLK